MAAAPAVPTKGACPPRRQSVGDMPKGPIPHRPAIPLKTPFSREAARRSRDGGFLCFGPSPWPRQETRTPQSPPDGGDSPLFKGAWTIRPAAPCPFVGAGPRPARILYPRPQVTAAVRRLSVGSTGETTPAKGRQHAGAEAVRPCGAEWNGTRPQGMMKRRSLRTIRFLSASLVPFCARRKELALRRNNTTDLRVADRPR